jgi:hypothetical protein
MTESVTTDSPTAHEAPLFSQTEIDQFGADDVQAGGAIGKMLAGLFFYTVIAMGIAGWWTWTSIEADKASAAASHGAASHGAATHRTESDGAESQNAAHGAVHK